MPNSPNPVAPRPQQAEQSGCLSVVARLVWMLVGNVALLFLLVKVTQSRGFSFYDLIFWTVVAMVAFVRYADIRWLRGSGSDGQPATTKDWIKYARLLILFAGGAWVVLHALLLLLRR